jgi:hypothetical protein
MDNPNRMEMLTSLKERLLGLENPSKDDLNTILMCLIKNSPIEAKDIGMDYSRLLLIHGWNDDTKPIFNHLWEYIMSIHDTKRKIQGMIMGVARKDNFS